MNFPQDARLLTCRRCGAGNRIPLERALTAPGQLRCGRCKAALLLDRDAAWHPPAAFVEGKPVSDEGAIYQHPLDRQALGTVKQVPGVDTLLKKLFEYTYERYGRLFHQASFVRAGNGQLPTLRAQFEQAAHRLGMTEVPDLYLFTDPTPNAYCAGVEHPYVAISTGLVDLLDDEEVGAALAHELSHWQCRHVLYKTATRWVVLASSWIATATLGLSSVVLLPLRVALLSWDRASELSADRGMLLATRDPMLCMRVLFKLAGGSFRLRSELSLDKFLEQAEEVRRTEDQSALLDRAYTVLQTISRTHPFPLWRAAELWRWACEPEYLELIQAS